MEKIFKSKGGICMIDFYKIGLDFYTSNDVVLDKNGGLFEYNIIREELKDISILSSMLVIVNGKFSSEIEELNLLSKLKTYDIVIFIATDIIALSENINIIKSCDYLLHQCLYLDFPEFSHLKQYYSYLPEAFFKYTVRRPQLKESKLIFGGGYRGNKTAITRYLNAVPSKAFVKDKTSDTRINYEQYLDEVAKCKYSLIISRKKYQKLGWITPRYVEALANRTLPICDRTYDRHNHFQNSIKIRTPSELKKQVEEFENCQESYDNAINHMITDIKTKTNLFKLLVKLIGEVNEDHSK